jgi:signal transduction histidine kinase
VQAEDINATSEPNEVPDAPEKEYTHYVHLANGEVVKVHEDDVIENKDEKGRVLNTLNVLDRARSGYYVTDGFAHNVIYVAEKEQETESL